MDIEATLTREHSRKLTLQIADYIGSDKRRFRELLDIFLNGEYRITQRAAWPLSYCGQRHPALVLPYTGQLLDRLNDPSVHDAVKRNILRVWQDLTLPEAYCGGVFDTCSRFLRAREEPVAVKAFSMTVMLNICKAYPELRTELRLLVEDLVPHGKPAIRSRGTKVLKALDKM